MQQSTSLEVWQRGPVPNINPWLQPAAHAILQTAEDLEILLKGFPDKLLWESPAGKASTAFHLQHMKGVLSRLFTYAASKPLTEEQLHLLAAEGKKKEGVTVEILLQQYKQQVKEAMVFMETLQTGDLLEPKGIGRKQIPTTTLGLIFHAAEHLQRHTGQLLVTVAVVMGR